MLESRLTSPHGELEREPRRVAAHSARKLMDRVLMTSDSGEYTTLSEPDYQRYLAGGISDTDPLAGELASKDFIRDRLNFSRISQRWVERFLLKGEGPSVHTIVVTRRCNLKCAYCHASVVSVDDLSTDMNLETARSLVDLIFQGQNKEITIEFQGGEPLLNWPIIRFIIDYAKLRNRAGQKILHFGLISNFSLLDDQKLDWLIERGVSFCTSLDGPPDLHDTNRVFLGGNGHEKTISGIKAIQSRRAAGIKVDIPNVISTVTKGSLNRANEIVDQVVSLGLERVQVGPLDPIGFARRSWARIGYEPKEFVDFYGQVLDAIIERNQQGIKLYEKMAMILLVRILRNEHWRFPFGDVIARIAYDWNGSVFSSEDGRLLAADNDAFFKLGHVQSTSLIDLLDQPLAQIGLLSSQAWSQPMCMQCVYSPYCSVQPVHNHATQGSVWGQMPTNRWCATIMGVFDAIFTRLNDPVKRKVLESWLDYADR